MGVHRCSIYVNDWDTRHISRVVKGNLMERKIQVLHYLGNIPNLNPIEKLWCNVKIKIVEKQPSIYFF